VTARRLGIALAAACLVGLSGCTIWGPEGGPGGAGIATGDEPATAVGATLGPDGVQRIEVTVGDNLRFSPSLVRARPGVIEFVFHNTGATAHDIRVEPGASATGNLNGGQTRTIRVTVEQPGQYPFPCLYHVSSGMQGTLEVVG
jgi:plastocyanin